MINWWCQECYSPWSRPRRGRHEDMAEGNQGRLRPCSVLLSIQVEKALQSPCSMPKTMLTLLFPNHPWIPRTQGIKPDLYAPATEASKVQPLPASLVAPLPHPRPQNRSRTSDRVFAWLTLPARNTYPLHSLAEVFSNASSSLEPSNLSIQMKFL